MKKKKEIQFSLLALGDSYTVGEQVSKDESFPYQFVKGLRAIGMHVAEPHVIAKTGWTTDELQAAIDNNNMHKDYDFVTLLIGVNNQYRRRDVNDYAKEFESLLLQAIDFAGDRPNRVTVLSIPDWSVTPFAGVPLDDGTMHDRDQAARAIDQYNAVSASISAKLKVHYLEITEGTREAASDDSLLTADGLHPSSKEYGRWAEKLIAIVSNEVSGKEIERKE